MDRTHRPLPQPGQVGLTGRLICADLSELMTVLAFLPDHVTASRAEPGCLWFDIAQSDDPLVWAIDEIFRDDQALAEHRALAAEREWSRATASIRREITRVDY